MTRIQVNGADLYYEEHGAGRETIVFSHGLMFSGQMFHHQVAALKDRYRCITFDFRGQGQSQVTQSGYDMESLYADAVSLLDGLRCCPCHFVGLSMGGFIGLRLAIRRPDLLKSLTLLESSADPEAEGNVGRYNMLNFVARWIGLRVVAGPVMKIMFGRKFLNDPNRAAQKHEYMEWIVSNHRMGITRAVTGVVTRAGVADQLGKIKTPTLIIVGDQDVATPPSYAQRMHAAIPGSRLVTIPGAGHSSTLEEPVAVTAAMQEFLSAHAG